jgi:hypothetical protein
MDKLASGRFKARVWRARLLRLGTWADSQPSSQAAPGPSWTSKCVTRQASSCDSCLFSRVCLRTCAFPALAQVKSRVASPLSNVMAQSTCSGPCMPCIPGHVRPVQECSAVFLALPRSLFALLALTPDTVPLQQWWLQPHSRSWIPRACSALTRTPHQTLQEAHSHRRVGREATNGFQDRAC